MTPIELLAPARNLSQGISAVNHGADALYIGAPSFGARAAATNSLSDIEQLVRYAHLYRARVYVTVNTLLFDNELEPAAKLIRQLYNLGVDAIILQDLGLLLADLPPIPLHASTQCHCFDPARIGFLQQVGFQRAILARETSLSEINAIHNATSIELEAFVHGALCVSFSGRCYLSQYLTSRSGNRGQCAQPCRSQWDLLDEKGTILHRNKHLLSLRDFNASQHLSQLIDAGVTSFKIEGRLKDDAYVRNITAYYRSLLDGILNGNPDLTPSSSGNTTLFFSPDPSRTFNRGFTTYFLDGRPDRLTTDSTQKSIGKQIGKVLKINAKSLTVSTSEPLHTGDGLCYLSNNELQGFAVNRVNIIQSDKSFLQEINAPPSCPPAAGTPLFRNHDIAFSRLLQGNSAERKVPVSMTLSVMESGLSLLVSDSDGFSASASTECPLSPAKDPSKAAQQAYNQLSKLGDSPFSLLSLSADNCSLSDFFIPASVLNALRRAAVEKLSQARQKSKPTPDCQRVVPTTPLPYPVSEPSSSLGITNHLSEQFYRLHGVSDIEYSVEKTQRFDSKPLMTTRYCLRFELGICLRKNPDYKGPLFLKNNRSLLRADFDCKNCLMRLYAVKNTTVPPTPER